MVEGEFYGDDTQSSHSLLSGRVPGGALQRKSIAEAGSASRLWLWRALAVYAMYMGVQASGRGRTGRAGGEEDAILWSVEGNTVLCCLARGIEKIR